MKARTAFNFFILQQLWCKALNTLSLSGSITIEIHCDALAPISKRYNVFQWWRWRFRCSWRSVCLWLNMLLRNALVWNYLLIWQSPKVLLRYRLPDGSSSTVRWTPYRMRQGHSSSTVNPAYLQINGWRDYVLHENVSIHSEFCNILNYFKQWSLLSKQCGGGPRIFRWRGTVPKYNSAKFSANRMKLRKYWSVAICWVSAQSSFLDPLEWWMR